MAYTTVNDGSIYFNIILHTGTSSDALPLIGAGFQPDWVWSKGRSNSGDHFSHDSNRGVQKNLNQNDNGEEATTSQGLQSFDSDGFTVGVLGGMNFLNQTYAHWLWKCNGGTTSSNTDGGVTGTTQANTAAGFSIMLYTGTGSTNTVGHGLGAKPDWIIYKRRDGGTRDWIVFHKGTGSRGMILNSSSVGDTAGSIFGGNTPTSTTIPIGSATETNTSSQNHIAYAFAPIQGYSKFGTYTGNANADGTFVYTGFKPRFLIIKSFTTIASWNLYDTARSPFNDGKLDAFKVNATDAETSSPNNEGGDNLDILSNGFKLITADNDFNGDNTYIYMAFAESPFVTSNKTPNNAR
jgi:hypothetical protein|tara:strand:+ start:364 stop:1416 length:1053 start_codon:yes stop_codon:yes gene_type:complete